MPLPKRIVIVGPTGSGKTTLARKLAGILNLTGIELDAIFWGPNWAQREPAEFISAVSEALPENEWVVDGNYKMIRNLVWERADTLVWLNYGLATVFRQLFGRTIRRVVRKEVLWNGNTETWRDQFLSTESLFTYAVRHTRLMPRTYPSLLQESRYAHLRVVELRSPRQTRIWLEKLARQRPA